MSSTDNQPHLIFHGDVSYAIKPCGSDSPLNPVWSTRHRPNNKPIARKQIKLLLIFMWLRRLQVKGFLPFLILRFRRRHSKFLSTERHRPRSRQVDFWRRNSGFFRNLASWEIQHDMCAPCNGRASLSVSGLASNGAPFPFCFLVLLGKALLLYLHCCEAERICFQVTP